MERWGLRNIHVLQVHKMIFYRIAQQLENKRRHYRLQRPSFGLPRVFCETRRAQRTRRRSASASLFAQRRFDYSVRRWSEKEVGGDK